MRPPETWPNKSIVKEGKTLGYEWMYLDTLEWMEAAIKLYERSGFEVIPAYNANPLEGVVYMRKRLY